MLFPSVVAPLWAIDVHLCWLRCFSEGLLRAFGSRLAFASMAFDGCCAPRASLFMVGVLRLLAALCVLCNFCAFVSWQRKQQQL